LEKNFIKTVALLMVLSTGVVGQTAGHSALATPEITPESGSETSLSSKQDSVEKAITILLPELKTKVSDQGGKIETRDLYRTVSVARGYLELGLFDEAMVWYERLAALDSDNLFADAIYHGHLMIAAGRGDSATLKTLISEMVGSVETPDTELVMSVMDQLSKEGKWHLVQDLIPLCSPLFGDKPVADFVYLQGRAMRHLGQLPEAIFHFERLLNSTKVPDLVHSSILDQKAKFIQGVADCSFLMNDRQRARSHYGSLLQEDDPKYRSWGRFQLAQLDMLDSSYPKAVDGFKQVVSDSLGLRIEEWAEKLIIHCLVMQEYKEYLIDSSPRPLAARR
jgi:tetratricopeptide (TPR) repeat protein